MWRFISGAIFGCLLGIIGSAFAAGIVGSGTLDGWTVIIDDEVAYADPIADATRHEIQCTTRT
jgi:hypothetical protein